METIGVETVYPQPIIARFLKPKPQQMVEVSHSGLILVRKRSPLDRP